MSEILSSPCPRGGRLAPKERDGWGATPASHIANRLITIRASGAESLLDSFQYAGYVRMYFIIPEANYLITTLLDQLCSPSILRGAIEMLGAVELDCQSRLRASEVRDEIADRKLSAKTKIGKSSGSKSRPELLFGIGLVVTQLTTAMVG